MLNKQCKNCGILKPLTEYHVCRGNKDELRGYCKTCKRIKDKEHYISNKDKIRDKKREYYKNNVLRFRQWKKEWNNKNKEKVRFWGNRWKQNNPEKIKAYNKLRKRDRVHVHWFKRKCNNLRKLIGLNNVQ